MRSRRTRPFHYVTYVRIYDASEDSVEVGYTPGYTGSYIDDDGLIVYGTGYDYVPWIGDVWYGPPITWGFGLGLAWTPWWGWSFDAGFGWGWGPGWGWGCLPAPWWGPVGWGWHSGGWHWHDGARVPPVVPWRPGGWNSASGGLLPAMGRDRGRFAAARSGMPHDAPSGRPVWPRLQLPHRRPGGGTAGRRPQRLSASVRLWPKQRLRGRRRARLPPRS